MRSIRSMRRVPRTTAVLGTATGGRAVSWPRPLPAPATAGARVRPGEVPPPFSVAQQVEQRVAAGSEDAGFWPVTSLPSVTTMLAQSAAFS